MSRILLVEDDQQLGLAIQKSIVKMGFEVDWARHPREAEQLSKTVFYEGLIIDCHLPEKSGIELAKALKDEQGKKCRLILMSGVFQGDDFIFEGMRKAGANRFLTKPFSLDRLSEIMRELFLKEPLDMGPFYDFVTCSNPPKFELLAKYKKGSLAQGYEIPLIISQMLACRQWNTLEIIENCKVVLKLSFHDGIINSIETPYNESREYLKVMACELHWPISVEELIGGTSLTQVSTENDLLNLSLLKRIPEHLVNEIIQREALFRLSNYINDSLYSINVYKTALGETNCWLNYESISQYLGEVVYQKVSPQWIQKQFLGLEDLKFHWRDLFRYKDIVEGVLTNRAGNEFANALTRGVSFNELALAMNFDRRIAFQSLYFFVVAGAMWFDDTKLSIEEKVKLHKERHRDHHGAEGRSGIVKAIANLKGEELKDVLLNHLIRRNTGAAKKLFYDNLSYFVTEVEGPLFKIWIQLQSKAYIAASADEKHNIEKELEMLSIELKYSALYHFVKGEFAKWIGRIREANNNYRTAQLLNDARLPTQKEIQLLLFKNKLNQTPAWIQKITDSFKSRRDQKVKNRHSLEM